MLYEVITAVENVVDLASEYHFSMLAKKAKDMSAGAVLVMSLYAVITGLIIFAPKLWALIFNYQKTEKICHLNQVLLLSSADQMSENRPF